VYLLILDIYNVVLNKRDRTGEIPGINNVLIYYKCMKHRKFVPGTPHKTVATASFAKYLREACGIKARKRPAKKR
jgi:hypothetical protein